jgi:Nucleotidyl transferase AbiEii toxin, Type IV TA system
MMDYFDLWALLGESTLDSAKLNRAINATFNRRKMALPTFLPVGLSDAFSADAIKRTQWHAFLNKNRRDDIGLPNVVTRLRAESHKVGVI